GRALARFPAPVGATGHHPREGSMSDEPTVSGGIKIIATPDHKVAIVIQCESAAAAEEFACDVAAQLRDGRLDLRFKAQQKGLGGQGMTDDELRDRIQKARQIASSVGTQHALWDVIGDAEAILDGRQSFMKRDEVERILREETNA